MKRLCYGVYAKILYLCSVHGKYPREIHNALSLILDPTDEHNIYENPSISSRWLNCRSHFCSKLSSVAHNVQPKQAVQLFQDSELFQNIIDPNKIEAAAMALRDIIQKDEQIRPTTIVDIVNQTTKQDLINSALSPSLEFFVGVFLYAIRVDNRVGLQFIGDLNDSYIANIETNAQQQNAEASSASSAADTSAVYVHSPIDNKEKHDSPAILLNSHSFITKKLAVIFNSRRNNIGIAVLIASLPSIAYFIAFTIGFGSLARRNTYLWFSYSALSFLVGSLYMYVRKLVMTQRLSKRFLSRINRAYPVIPVIMLAAIAVFAAVNQNVRARLVRTIADVFYVTAISALALAAIAIVLHCIEKTKQSEHKIESRILFPWLPIIFASAYVINTTFVRTVIFGRLLTPYLIVMYMFYIVIVGFVCHKIQIAASAKIRNMGIGPKAAAISIISTLGLFLYSLYDGLGTRRLLAFVASTVLCAVFYIIFRQVIKQE